MSQVYTLAVALLTLGHFTLLYAGPDDPVTPVTVYFQCNDYFTNYVNGTRVDAQRVQGGGIHIDVWKYETSIKPGDVIGFSIGNTVGARHLTVAVFSGDKFLFGTDTNGWILAAQEPDAGWWTLPIQPADRHAVLATGEPVERNVPAFFKAIGSKPDGVVPIWGLEEYSHVKRVVTASDLASP